jgi:asparagine synthase (glutamine-hydrolysing)
LTGPLTVQPHSTEWAPTVGAAFRGPGADRRDPPSRIWAAVDGFLTNRAALADQLDVPPDAETSAVVARAYERWGPACVERLEGQWALIVCDLEQDRSFAARDHLGIGQLYYSADGNHVLVASEPKAVARAQPAGPEIEPVRFGEFLNGFPPTTPELSFFRGVQSIAAGAMLRIERATEGAPRVQIDRYWDPRALRGWTMSPPPFTDAARRFETLLVTAVRRRGTPGETGALLSGGLDSSVLAVIAAEFAGTRPLPSFSILHADPDLTEERHVNAVVAHAGLKSHTATIRPADAWQAVDAVVTVQGEPLLGQDLIGQWHAYRLAAEHGTRSVFDGIGADELLAGVGTESRYFRDLLLDGEWQEFAREVRAFGTRHEVSPVRTLRRYVAGPLKRELSWALRPRRYRWLSRDLPPDPYRDRLRTDVAPDHSLLNGYLYRHVRHQNAPTVLGRLDRCAAAHGLRSLVPYLDRSVVEWCLPLPGRYKVFRGQPKRLLHSVARRHLPAEVADRRDKQGIVPTKPWMAVRTEFAEAFRAVPHERRVRESGWIDPRAAERFIEGYLAERHTDHLGVWRLFTAWRWLELFRLS